MEKPLARLIPTFLRIHRESRFFKDSSLFVPILGAFVLPIMIGLIGPSIISYIWFVIFIFTMILPAIIFALILGNWIMGESFMGAAWKYLRPLPPGYVFGTDLKRDRFPWVTASLIFVNIVVFIYQIDNEGITDWGMFLPVGDSGAVHKLASLFTCAFLHGDLGHLAGNMVFLWVFGTALEPRTGHKRFGLLYIAAIIASGFFRLVVLLIEALINPTRPMIDDFHSLGASGAIAGIMGLFAVRCFFARVTVSFPFFFVPFLSMPLRVQGATLLGFFFAMDTRGSARMLVDSSIQIDYWAHFGGYIGGFLLGYMLEFHKDASKEAVRSKAERYSKNENYQKESLELYERILQEEPDHEAALEFMFKKYARYNEVKAASYFAPLVDIRMKVDFKKALELVDYHFPKFISHLSGATLFRLGGHYLANGELIKARTVLDFASEKEGPFQAKAMMLLGQSFEYMGSIDRAKLVFSQIAERFPHTAFEKAARARIKELDSECHNSHG